MLGETSAATLIGKHTASALRQAAAATTVASDRCSTLQCAVRLSRAALGCCISARSVRYTPAAVPRSAKPQAIADSLGGPCGLDLVDDIRTRLGHDNLADARLDSRETAANDRGVALLRSLVLEPGHHVGAGMTAIVARPAAERLVVALAAAHGHVVPCADPVWNARIRLVEGKSREVLRACGGREQCGADAEEVRHFNLWRCVCGV